MYTWEFKEFAAVGMGLLRKLHVLLTKPNIFCYPAPSTRIRIFLIRIFSLRIQLPFTRIQEIWHTNPQLFESALKSGNFLILYESGISWTLNPDILLSSDVTRSSPVLYREYSIRCREQCYRFFTSWTSVSSLIRCVQLKLAMITVHFNYDKRRLYIVKLLSMSDERVQYGCGWTWKFLNQQRKPWGFTHEDSKPQPVKKNFLVQIWSLGFQI